MTYEAAILYAMQQMRKMGRTPEQYDFTPERIITTYDELYAGQLIILAYNELYILIKPENYANLLITADNTIYNSDTSRRSGVTEFTGMIRLQAVINEGQTGYIAIDFLRVMY